MIIEDKPAGYYEKRLCLLLFLSSIPNGITTFQVLVLHFTPNHRCDVLEENKSELPISKNLTQNLINSTEQILNLTIPWEITKGGKLSRSKCFQFESFNISQENKTKIPCKSMYFEGIEVSAVTEFNLVCDKAWLRPIFTSVQFVGMMIGSVLGGYLADRFGRRPAFLVSTAWQFISLLLLSFAPEAWSYVVLYLLSSAASLISYIIATVITSEMATKDNRILIYFILFMGYAIGYLMMSPLAYWFRDWRWFLRFCGSIGIMYIPYYWLIDETPRWLLASGRVEDARQVLRKIAKLNNNVCESVITKPQTCPGKHSFTVLQTIVKIVKERVLVFRLAVVSFMWFTMGMMYYILAFNTNNLSGNRFINILLSGIVELVGGVIFLFCERKMGRVNTYIIPTALFGLSMIMTCFVPESQVAILITLDMIGKLTAATSFALIYIYVVEFFPTKARQTVLFTASVASKFGGILAPFLILIGEEGDILTPYLIVVALVLVCVISSAFLPETKGVALPQTVEEAKAMPRKQWCTSGQSDGEVNVEATGEMHPLSEVNYS